MELAIGEIERFEQSDLYTIKEVENLLLNSRNIDPDRLKIQLLMLPDMIKTAFAGEAPANVRTIASAMEQSGIYKGMLSEIDKILKFYFMFPVTSATAERSFSSLRRIKTYLRNYESLQAKQSLFTLCPFI